MVGGTVWIMGAKKECREKMIFRPTYDLFLAHTSWLAGKVLQRMETAPRANMYRIFVRMAKKTTELALNAFVGTPAYAADFSVYGQTISTAQNPTDPAHAEVTSGDVAVELKSVANVGLKMVWEAVGKAGFGADLWGALQI